MENANTPTQDDQQNKPNPKQQTKHNPKSCGAHNKKHHTKNKKPAKASTRTQTAKPQKTLRLAKLGNSEKEVIEAS
jgi:hypothetical protein